MVAIAPLRLIPSASVSIKEADAPVASTVDPDIRSSFLHPPHPANLALREEPETDMGSWFRFSISSLATGTDGIYSGGFPWGTFPETTPSVQAAPAAARIVE
jgi:hypothetical protein